MRMPVWNRRPFCGPRAQFIGPIAVVILMDRLRGLSFPVKSATTRPVELSHVLLDHTTGPLMGTDASDTSLRKKGTRLFLWLAT